MENGISQTDLSNLDKEELIITIGSMQKTIELMAQNYTAQYNSESNRRDALEKSLQLSSRDKSGNSLKPENVLETAKKFEAYVTGNTYIKSTVEG